MIKPIIELPKEEIFVPITETIVQNVHPWYSISNFGNIYSLYSNKFLKPSIDSKGYKYVVLYTLDGPKNQRVHRLLMLAFKYFYGCEKYVINHVDGNKLNNNLWNLEWCTIQENNQHAFDFGLIKNPGAIGSLSDLEANEICKLLVEGNMTYKEIAEKFNTTRDIIASINCKKAYTSISDNYNIKNRKQVLSDDQIELICNYFQNNPRNKKLKNDYLTEAFNALQIPITNTTLCIGERILYRQSFNKITSKYNY